MTGNGECGARGPNGSRCTLGEGHVPVKMPARRSGARDATADHAELTDGPRGSTFWDESEAERAPAGVSFFYTVCEPNSPEPGKRRLMMRLGCVSLEAARELAQWHRRGLPGEEDQVATTYGVVFDEWGQG